MHAYIKEGNDHYLKLFINLTPKNVSQEFIPTKKETAEEGSEANFPENITLREPEMAFITSGTITTN